MFTSRVQNSIWPSKPEIFLWGGFATELYIYTDWQLHRPLKGRVCPFNLISATNLTK